MSKRKVLLINFVPGGGIKQFTHQILNRLPELGVEYSYKETRSLKELFRLCRSYQEVIFCVNNVRIYLLLLFLRGFSPILILHDHKPRVGASKVERFQIACAHFFAKRFKKIIIHSDDNRFSREKNVVVTRMPFHSPSFSETDKTRVLFFGRIDAYKNLPFLAKLALETQDTTEYFIAGGGEINPELRSLINRAANISLINLFIDAQTIRLLFEWCDYLILPYSDMTQTGLVDQGGYFGKPVILSNIEGFKPYLGKKFCVQLDIENLNESVETIKKLPKRHSHDYEEMCRDSIKNYEDSLNCWPGYMNKLLN